MGSLVELVVSFGLFAVCLAGGVLAVYQNLDATGRLYEVGGQAAPGLTVDGLNVEQTARRDAQAYAALVRSAQQFALNGSSCSFNIATLNEATFRAASNNNPRYPDGYAIAFLQFNGTGYEPLTPNATSPIIAQLSRVGVQNSVLGEVLIRCSARKL